MKVAGKPKDLSVLQIKWYWMESKALLNQAAGDPRGETAYSRTYLPWRAYYPFGPPLFMRAADVWYRQWVDRSQNRARARDLGSGR